MRAVPVPSGRDMMKWATDTVGFLRDVVREIETPAPKIVQLQGLTDKASAAQDGVMMWDTVNGKVAVSYNGQWYDLTMTLKP